MTKLVKIFDTTLRDGEQCPGASLNTEEKIRVAQQLALLKVDVLEAGFPVASPGDFEAVEAIAKKIRGPIIAGLARANKGDITSAGKALKPAPRKRIHTFIATSENHMKHKLRQTREAVLESAVGAVKFARKFTDDVEFSPEDATRSDPDFLCRVVEAVIKAGAGTINIPDTVGYAVPDAFGQLITMLRERVPGMDHAVLSVHCHNDLGLAVANSLSAIQAGARQVECTVNGIGERAGNASLEEIVMALKTRKDFFKLRTGIQTKEIVRSSRLVSDLTGFVIQKNKAVVGQNAFAHEAGIHQDGMMKDRTTYEIMTPSSVGWGSSQLVLGKHSGRHAFAKRLRGLGVVLSGSELGKAFARFKILADKKKEIFDDDLLALAADENRDLTTEYYELVYISSVSGNQTVPTATVRIKVKGQIIQEAACGAGPVDALTNAIDRITKIKATIFDYTIRGITSGRDALGEVNLVIQTNGHRVPGKGVSTDIVEASARAYLNALNRYLALRAEKRTAKKTFKGSGGI